MKEIVVDSEKYLNFRLDKVLLDYLGELYSRSFIQKLILDKKIMVNDKVVKVSYRLRLNDKISILDREIKKLSIEKEDIPLDIVYEDIDIIVVNKPQGMIVHPAQNINTGTLVNALMHHCKDLSAINGIERPGIVHRIDKNTSGVLVIAKNDFSHRFLSEQFKVHSIRREYVALLNGVIKDSEGTVSGNIGRHPKDRIKMAIVKNSNGKSAITEFKVLKRYHKHSLVLCKLHTGRTHQIRVHMSSIGFPIVGDSVYGLKKNDIYNEGQLLHARVIGFVHPSTKRYIEFKVKIPDYFKNIISNL